MDWTELETPVALIDLERVRANAEQTARYCRAHGLNWRPHTKTHKCPEIARIELAAGARGLTVATLREAEVMAEVCDDLLLAYPPVGDAKLSRLFELPERVRISVALDSESVLFALSASAAKAGRRIGVFVELDVGGRRVGVGSPERALSLAQTCQSLDGVEYRGILFHPGHIRAGTPDQPKQLQRLADDLCRYIETLRQAGCAPPEVSGGSTPTLFQSHQLPGLTEVRAGTIIFNDRDIVAQGVVTETSCAYSVLATIVSTEVPGQAVIDAGSKALAKETLPDAPGFGALLDHPEVRLRALSEEHGILDLSQSTWQPQVGQRVRVVPNHVCVSVNLQDALFAFDPAHSEPPHAAQHTRPTEPTQRPEPTKPTKTTQHIQRWPVRARGRERYRTP